jgi:hypothetical protein
MVQPVLKTVALEYHIPKRILLIVIYQILLIHYQKYHTSGSELVIFALAAAAAQSRPSVVFFPKNDYDYHTVTCSASSEALLGTL